VQDRLRPLPSQIERLLRDVVAPPRLVAHLTLVYDVASTVLERLTETWPTLSIDRAAVIFGAATHDIGKAVNRGELGGPGEQHGDSGYDLLVAQDIPALYARFTRTHARWDDPAATLEDLLVAWADSLWRGGRPEDLEMRIARTIEQVVGQELWRVFIVLDDLATDIGEDADARLFWQGMHPAE